MKRKVLIWSFALIFAITPLLVTAQGANSNGGETPTGEASITDMMAIIEQFYEEGEFNNHGSARSLLVHLTSVNHFYQKGEIDKATKHMNSFIQFLDLQKDNGMISEHAHSVLQPLAENLLLEWNALTIVENGQANAAIRLSLTATDMEQLAASELQETIQMISGAELPIVTNGESNLDVQITLVTPDSNPEISQHFTEDLDFLQDSDGFAIRRSDNEIFIIGANPRGLLNGVYEFLEENTGILWTRSKEEGTIYQPQSTIKAAKVDYREKSPFEIRGWHTTGRGDEGISHIDFKTFKMFARNKLNAKYASFGNQPYWAEHEAMGLQAVHLGHNLSQWLPNDEYFDSHPEYYDMVDGEYVPVSGRTQLNFFHPDLPGVFAGKVIDFHAETGNEYIGIGIQDTNNFTQSPESRQPFTTPDGVVVQPDDPAFRSTVFFTFLNKVAAEVKETYPDVRIAAFAYYFAETPPKVELEDNIVLLIAPIHRDLRLPLNTDNQDSRNYESRLKLEEWVTKTKNIIYRGYYGCCAADAYERPIAEVVQADAQYFRDLGIMGFLPEGIVDANRTAWGVNALQFWLINQLYWDPDADLEALKDEFIQKAYGDAAESMKHYYDLMEQGWNHDQQPIGIYANESMLITQYVIQAGIKEEAQAALDEAWELANDLEKLRIEPILSTFTELTELYGDPNHLTANAIKTNTPKEEILQSLDFSSGPWTEAEPVSAFNIHRTDDPAPVDTNVYLLWDDEHLYVGYENFDDDISNLVISDVLNNWWQDGTSDSAETHVSNGQGGTTYAYFNNPESSGFAYRSGPSPAPDVSIESNAVILSDRWNIVQAIPFAHLDFDPIFSRELTALFVRNYHGSANYTWGGGYVWSPPDQGSVFLVE